jgi:hypothetical protein
MKSKFEFESEDKETKKALDKLEKVILKTIPTGVSQWREEGKKYGYWGYFEKVVREENKEHVWHKIYSSFPPDMENLSTMTPNQAYRLLKTFIKKI